jgi:hypothetical protein
MTAVRARQPSAMAKGAVKPPVSEYGFLVCLVTALVLAGCGGSADHGKTAKQLTIPAYASFPAVTVPITKGTPARCRLDAKGFTRDAVAFLAPRPATPPDVYFLGARTAYIDFEAHRCETAYLRGPLSRRLTAAQRRRLVARFTFLGKLGDELSRKAPRK